MNISSFFIDRPIFASVISIIIVVAGLVADAAAADQRISRDRAADRRRQRAVSGRIAQDDRRNRHHAARAADQRRRERDLHELIVDARRRVLDHRDVPPRHRPRHGAGADPEPRQPGADAPAAGGAPDRPGHAEALARSHDGRVSHVPRRALRLAVSAQLRGHPDPGRAGAPAGRGRRARVRLGRLRDASVARSGKDRRHAT